MKPTVTLAVTKTPDGSSLALLQHDQHYYLQVDGIPLQSSFAHGTARELARLACAAFRAVRQPRLLIAGMGLGYTVAAAREELPQKRAIFLVAEALEELLTWHRRYLAGLHPAQLEDPRLVVRHQTPIEALKEATEGFHAILLDAGGQPSLPGVTDRKGLPVSSFLHRANSTLKEGGLLAVSCSIDASSVERRLRQAGFDVAHESVPASHKGKQKHRTSIWLARKGAYQKRSPGHGDALS